MDAGLKDGPAAFRPADGDQARRHGLKSQRETAVPASRAGGHEPSPRGSKLPSFQRRSGYSGTKRSYSLLVSFRLVNMFGAGFGEINFHDLRHSAVNTLRKGGCDAKDIQSWLGHSDVSTTLNVYERLMDGDMSRMGSVMDQMLFQTSC